MALISASGDSCSTFASSTPRWNYHVFLSFRGEDTRTNFTDHLYAALQWKGIVTFRDDEELERGEIISEKLMKAVEESLFAIVILSPNYTSSSWCLDELQKIIESRENLGLTVFPVFYGVDPSDIRHQKGISSRAFEKHGGKFTEDKVGRWRRALTEVASFAGWDTRNKHEAGIVEKIVEAIWTKLHVKLPSNFAHLVGLQSKVDKLVSLLKIELNHKCFIGICGMGGIGKTTLARVVYEAIQSKFETSCFLANVREDSENGGLVYLQKKLISSLRLGNFEINDSYDGVKAIRNFLCNKKVLIVLDDISHISQLQNLAGDKDWFGDGSKIIITTRDIHLLTVYDQFEKYEMKMLESNESFKLFCQHAFKMDYPEEGYWELSKKVVEYAGGLPLALQVLGSFLCKRNQSEWKDTLDKLKKNLHKDIFKTLRISYDGLDDEEYKTIFLDIACYFIGEEKVEATNILENCDLHPTIGIQVLVEKQLLSHISGENDKEFLRMHDLLQEMAKNIVLQESSNDAGKCSRLWSQEQIDLVFTRNTGTQKVESIVLNLEQPYEANWHPDCFSKVCNLRLLNLNNVHLLHSLNSLPTALKVFIWKKFPLKALPHNIDQLHELVELTLQHSKIRKLWNGRPLLGKLKFMDLNYSSDLTDMPDFSGVPNLERLLLEGCINLVKIHDSLGQLKKLVKLNLRGCKNLVTLPRKLELNSLKEFSLCGCFKLEKLPEFGENMKCLSTFDLSSTNIREVPSSIIHLTNLKVLSLQFCGDFGIFFKYFGHLIHRYMGIPISMGLKLSNSFLSLSSLKELDLSFCRMWDGSIPNDFSGLSSLVKLDLRSNNFTILPVGCFSNLLNLEKLDLSYCDKLQSIPELPPNLIRVYVCRCPSIEASLDVQHLFASLLVHKRRSLLQHEVTFLLISRDEIPITFFKEQKCDVTDHFGSRVSIIVDIPYIRYESELWGIAVCFIGEGGEFSLGSSISHFSWGFRALEDESFVGRIRTFSFERKYVGSVPHIYMAFFPFNTQNSWRHLRGERRQLELQIRFGSGFSIKDCCWRLICEKDFNACNTSTATSSLQIKELGNNN